MDYGIQVVLNTFVLNTNIGRRHIDRAKCKYIDQLKYDISVLYRCNWKYGRPKSPHPKYPGKYAPRSEIPPPPL